MSVAGRGLLVSSSPVVRGVPRLRRLARARLPDMGVESSPEGEDMLLAAAALSGLAARGAVTAPIGGSGSLVRSMTLWRTGGPSGAGFAIRNILRSASLSRL